MMTVTEHAKKLGESDPSWAAMCSALPVASYNFNIPYRHRGDALKTGEEMHKAFERYASGEWVQPLYYNACVTIEEALADLGVCEVDSEVAVELGELRGQIDLVGHTDAGQPAIIELKVTLGDWALNPRASEVAQIATYSAVMKLDNPLLACIRVSLSTGKLNVFRLELPAYLDPISAFRRN